MSKDYVGYAPLRYEEAQGIADWKLLGDIMNQIHDKMIIFRARNARDFYDAERNEAADILDGTFYTLQMVLQRMRELNDEGYLKNDKGDEKW